MKSIIYVDISALYANDLRTGIQRVVRSILQELFENISNAYCVMPVYFQPNEVGYYFAASHVPDFVEAKQYPESGAIIDPRSGDIFLGLDLHHSAIIQSKEVGLYQLWVSRGVNIHFIVYDLLPVLHPSVFPPGIEELHREWLKAIASVAHSLIAISNSVQEELRVWLKKSGAMRKSLTLSYFHLGGDILSSLPTVGLPQNYPVVIDRIDECPSFLMVGTIEPRKGHLQVLNAFEQLWAKGAVLNLVIVGHEGWQEYKHEERGTIPQIVTTLKTHKELGRRLFWLDGISDEYLSKVYGVSACHISASLGEGFGLPLIESAKHNLPILARDIPVFRELCGDSALFFEDGYDDNVLVVAIERWLVLYYQGVEPKSETLKWLTWHQSAQQLMELIKVSVGCSYES